MNSVVVVGDTLLDVDVLGRVERFAPDSTAPVFEETERAERPGGAALAALLAAADTGVEVTLVTPRPDDEAAATVARLLGNRVRVLPLPADGATGVKTRLLAEGQVVARHDRGGDRAVARELPSAVAAALTSADAVLVSDYGRGATTHSALRAVLAEQAGRRTVVWDPHPHGGAPVPGVRLATPNANEAAAALRLAPAVGVAQAVRQARALVDHWHATAVAITLGDAGTVLADTAGATAVPARERVTGDACGAGDRFAARATTALAAGALPSEAVYAAVAASAAFLAAGGVEQLGRARPIAPPPTDGPTDVLGVLPELTAVRRRGGVIVATGGCFDLLHAGHLATLEAARRLGDLLVVCLNSDRSIRRVKGSDRPLQPAAERARLLRGLRCVDAVVVFDEDTPEALLDRLRPDVWVKGGDYAAGGLPEADLVSSFGGTVVTVPYLAGRSTTRLLEAARQ